MKSLRRIPIVVPFSLFNKEADFKDWPKCESWTWKSDFRYYWFWLPVTVAEFTLGWLFSRDSRNEMGLIETIELAEGMADARSGRMFHWKSLSDSTLSTKQSSNDKC